MENGEFHYGCLVRVKDLAKAKHFYTEVLALGAPVLDSNFWVEYPLPGNGLLVLEHCGATKPGEGREDVSCLLEVADLDAKVSELREKKVEVVHPAIEVPGRATATIRDPEGNLITLYKRTGNGD